MSECIERTFIIDNGAFNAGKKYVRLSGNSNIMYNQKRLTRRISSCMRCFFVSRVDPSGFSFRVQRSLYSASKFELRCNVAGSTGGNMSNCKRL